MITSVSHAAGNISDVDQVGAVTIPWQAKADWLGEVPEAWRDHMGSKLANRRTARQAKFNRPMMNPISGSDGPETIPLDQASVSGVLQWVSNEDVRKQVLSLKLDFPLLSLMMYRQSGM